MQFHELWACVQDQRSKAEVLYKEEAEKEKANLPYMNVLAAHMIALEEVHHLMKDCRG